MNLDFEVVVFLLALANRQNTVQVWWGGNW